MSTRGIRNNNPANIRRGCNWKGLTEKQTDKEFCQFITMTWGVRALLVTLRTYVVKHKLHTISQIIERWAPPQDGNATNRYIDFVKEEVYKYSDGVVLGLNTYNFKPQYQHPICLLYLIAKAMCKMESGYDLNYGVYLLALQLM